MQSQNDITINWRNRKVRDIPIAERNATKVKSEIRINSALPQTKSKPKADSTIILENGVVTLLLAPEIIHGAFVCSADARSNRLINC